MSILATQIFILLGYLIGLFIVFFVGIKVFQYFRKRKKKS